MNILSDIVPTKNEKIFWQRIVETFKWAYARRTELADPDYVDISLLLASISRIFFIESPNARTVRTLEKRVEVLSKR